MKKNIRKIKTPGESTIKTIFNFGHFALTKPGFTHFSKKARKALGNLLQKQQITYNDWAIAQGGIDVLRHEYEKNIHKLPTKPKISIIIIINNTAPFLNATLNSVYDQLYPYWELCIVYNAGDPGLKNIAHNIQKDNRIRIVPANSSEQYELLNAGATNASHDLILLMQDSDVLSADCLYCFAKHINTHPADNIIYADNDQVDSDGRYTTPNFKPGWAPDSLLSRNYIGYPVVISKALWKGAGGCRQDFADNEIYDFLLRATELTNAIGHIPKVLCHKQASIALKTNNETAIKTINETLERQSTPGHTVQTNATGIYNIDYELLKPGKVSIIIPTKDHAQLLKTAIDSIIEKTAYADWELIIVNNNSVSPDFFQLMTAYERKLGNRFRCINAGFPFNFSKLINLGVSESNGDYILMLNNDVAVLCNDWLTNMVAYAQHERTGAVGAKLLFPDNTIQHAGIVLGGSEITAHIFMNLDKGDPRYTTNLQAVNNYSAVTGACLMCRKELYNSVHGMDEHLPVEYNDVDLCLKFMKAGHYNVYLPAVELYHYESATRGHPFRSKKAWRQHEKDLAVFAGKWQKQIAHDPYCIPDLSALG